MLNSCALGDEDCLLRGGPAKSCSLVKNFLPLPPLGFHGPQLGGTEVGVHSSTVLVAVVSDLAMLSTFSAQPTKQVLPRHKCSGHTGIRDSKEVLALASLR